MKQTIFETRQRADELLRRAMEIWRGSDRGDRLEGIENDPAFSLLMTALAYQANETEEELEQMKSEVLDDFRQMLTPYETGHAIPATALVQTAVKGNEASIDIDSRHTFELADAGVKFMPLLQTRVYNVTARSVVRLDGRRWKVELAFGAPVTDVSKLCFVINNPYYRDLKVFAGTQQLPLVKPWHYDELPLSKAFGIDNMLYNQRQTYVASPLSLDLFARQNVRMYFIKPYQPTPNMSLTDSLELTFEFTGLSDGFEFNKDSLLLNTVLLVNAQQHTASLSSSIPIVRVVGYDSSSADSNRSQEQFLHLIRPSDDQLYGDAPVEVRRVSADRFNQGALLKMLNGLVNRYYSDFYAFQNIQEAASDSTIQELTQIISRMINALQQSKSGSIPGVYLMLRRQASRSSSQGDRPPVSLDVPYLTTSGAGVNELLTADSTFVAPSGLDSEGTRQIAAPIPGADEIRGEKSEAALRRYYMVTADRLVTNADIKLFCYYELQARYGIDRHMVKQITVSSRQECEHRLSGYEILVEIVLVENAFIKRGFADKRDKAEILLKSMMNVRSTNIYPIQVMIRLEPDSPRK